jgi:ArsR family transcriptional regulator, arsenate/arsenite/antimonite-responsive transcriptional repressor / arsenate reductase (thioredoxin)
MTIDLSSSSSKNKSSVLFLCTGNSARSQMAEALLRAKAGELFNVFSAGTHPETIDPRTLTTLSDFGLSTESLTAKSIDTFTNIQFDYVITLCDKANQECRAYSGAAKQLAWDFPDPKTRSGNRPFTITLTELSNRIAMFRLVEGKKTFNQDTRSITQKNSTGATDVMPLNAIAFYKCLTDDIRLKCLMLLQYHGELCVCELMTSLSEQSQPKVSRNLALLKKVELLTTRKHGQWVFYQLNNQLPQWAKTVLALTTENNIDFIEGNIQALAQMDNRPDKASFCS